MRSFKRQRTIYHFHPDVVLTKVIMLRFGGCYGFGGIEEAWLRSVCAKRQDAIQGAAVESRLQERERSGESEK